jgi:hypothetical protein
MPDQEVDGSLKVKGQISGDGSLLLKGRISGNDVIKIRYEDSGSTGPNFGRRDPLDPDKGVIALMNQPYKKYYETQFLSKGIQAGTSTKIIDKFGMAYLGGITPTELILQPRGANVGIGVANPTSLLHLNVPGSSDPISAMTIDVQSFGNAANLSRSHFLQVRDILAAPPHGDTKFIIRGDGNVGIGTDTPDDKLVVIGDIRASGYVYAESDLHTEGHVHVGGDVNVTGDVFLAGGADCAEDFDIVNATSVTPGTVMVINEKGTLSPSYQEYDKRVAGVISGAGDFRPGITLDRKKGYPNRLPIALFGKVFCNVDTEFGSIDVGDLLTTSPTRGHAMKVIDHGKALGTVIGKALREFTDGKGMIPILVALQ